METESTARLWPLQLTAFEEYMMADDHPSHPMMMVLQADVTGVLRESEFREAVEGLLRDHPLLCCTVSRVDGRLCWQPAAVPADLVEWIPAQEQDALTYSPDLRRRDLTKETGCRVRAVVSAQRARILVDVHHACCDGLAALQLVAELLARYGAATTLPGEECPKYDPVEIALLTERNRFRPVAAKRKRSLKTLVAKLWRLTSRQPLRLLGTRERGGVDAAAAEELLPHGRAFWLQTLSQETVDSLRGVAAGLRVSINDLLLQQAFFQVRDWNRAAGPVDPQGWIRIAVPLSMRESQHTGIPACNMVSYGLVTHSVEETRQPADLLAKIKEKTSSFLRSGEGRIALKMFDVLRRIPFGLRMFLSRSSGAGTIVMTTVGDVSRRLRCSFPLQGQRWVAGNVTVQKLGGAPPVRPGTPVSITVAEYAGQMTIGLRSDGNVLSETDSQEFLQQFVGRVEAVATGRQEVSPAES